MIYKMDRYTNDKGQVLETWTSREMDSAGYVTTEPCKYLMVLRMMMPYGPEEVPVAIESATSLEDAFSKYDSEFNKMKQKIAEEKNKRKIAMPGDLPSKAGKLIV